MAAKTLTVNQAAAAFGVTAMTLYLWRKGTPTRAAMPHDVVKAEGKQRRVLMPVAKTRAWARKHGIEFKVDPDVLLEREAAEARAAKKESAGSSPPT